jgi:hypothetical protein
MGYDLAHIPWDGSGQLDCDGNWDAENVGGRGEEYRGMVAESLFKCMSNH